MDTTHQVIYCLLVLVSGSQGRLYEDRERCCGGMFHGRYDGGWAVN